MDGYRESRKRNEIYIVLGVFIRGSFIEVRFIALSDYRDHFAAGTARTGHCAPRRTCSVVLPRSASTKSRWPCVASTMRSGCHPTLGR